MSTRTWTEIQQRLIDLGYNLGPSGADGDPGRFTREAVQKFQAEKKLPINWPGTVGPVTLAALFPGDTLKAKKGAEVVPPVPPPLVQAPWVQLGLSKKGLSETGKTKAALMQFLRSDGKTLGDPAQLPWCGDFVQTCIAVSIPMEPVPGNPYWARNWLNFGAAIEPTFGAVVVFSRGKSGHVAFIVGESTDGKSFIILGGNQSNSISVTTKSRETFLGARWPKLVDRPTITLPRMRGGKLSINEA